MFNLGESFIQMSALLEEKDNEIDEQRERLLVLTERVTVSNADSDDARIQGLEKEVGSIL